MKKQKNLTRKQKAFRSVLLLLILMLTANDVFHTGYLLPVQALRYQEELLGSGRTTIIERRWEPSATDAPWVYTIYFAENEHVTLMKGVGFSFLRGWTGDMIKALDCSREAPLYAGQFWKSCRDHKMVCYLFGRVDDPAIQRVTISDGEELLTVYREAFIEQDGKLYFLLRKEHEMRPVQDRYQTACAWDSNGALIAEIAIKR